MTQPMTRGVVRAEPVVLDPDPTAPGRARDYVRAWCLATGVGGDALDTAVLLTSEVVTNAFLHGRSLVRLSASTTSGGGTTTLRVEVGDDNARHPTLLEADGGALDGRGMGIVEMCAAAWGVVDQPYGKVVWFDVAVYGG